MSDYTHKVWHIPTLLHTLRCPSEHSEEEVRAASTYAADWIERECLAGKCNCGPPLNLPGLQTGGWHCPIHGRQM